MQIIWHLARVRSPLPRYQCPVFFRMDALSAIQKQHRRTESLKAYYIHKIIARLVKNRLFTKSPSITEEIFTNNENFCDTVLSGDILVLANPCQLGKNCRSNGKERPHYVKKPENYKKDFNPRELKNVLTGRSYSNHILLWRCGCYSRGG